MTVRVGEMEGEAVPLEDREGDREMLGERVVEDDLEGESVVEGEVEGDLEEEGERLPLGESVGEGLVDGEREGVRVVEGEREGLGVVLELPLLVPCTPPSPSPSAPPPEGVGEVEEERDVEGDVLPVLEVVEDMDGDTLTDRVRVTLTDAVLERVDLRAGEGEERGHLEGVRVRVLTKEVESSPVGDFEPEVVPLRVGKGVRVRVGEKDKDGVGEEEGHPLKDTDPEVEGEGEMEEVAEVEVLVEGEKVGARGVGVSPPNMEGVGFKALPDRVGDCEGEVEMQEVVEWDGLRVLFFPVALVRGE